MKNVLIGLFLIVVMVSCDNYPGHMVSNKKHMTVYKTELLSNGKYRYAITDSSSAGWTLITNDQFNIGDTIKITK